jgi:parvulin-like peptidyl-prolyl isomerase
MKKPLATLVLAAALGAGAHAEILEQIIVKVNGEILTKTELEQRQVLTLRARNRAVGAADLGNDAELRKQIEDVTPQIMVETIDEMLIMQLGKTRGYRLGDDQFNRIVENIRKENKLEDEDRFKEALKQEGMTIADLRKSLERQMVVSRIQNDAIGRLTVTDEEARAYYDARSEEFSTPSSLSLREILVEVPSTAGGGAFSAALDEEAKARADALRARAAAGEDFAGLAAAESSAGSKANGGLIGPFNRDELSPALQKLVDALQPGGITPVIRAQRGYQFFKLESFTPPQKRPFEEAREDIVNKVYSQKRAAEFRKFMQKQRNEAIIEWKNEEARKAYELQIAREASGQVVGAATPPGAS